MARKDLVWCRALSEGEDDGDEGQFSCAWRIKHSTIFIYLLVSARFITASAKDLSGLMIDLMAPSMAAVS
uniref:Uncharacterized protein n=1 Tax=Cannabis sativa TaxID=3483 RepID=A0A803QS54_CANSA